MAKWIDVGPADQFPPGAQQCVEAGGVPVVVINLGGRVIAIANSCPHAGLPIGEGELRGRVLTCPFHGYAYNLQTGLNIDFADDLPLTTFPVRCTDEQRVQIDLHRGREPNEPADVCDDESAT